MLLSHIHNRLPPQTIRAIMCLNSWSQAEFVDMVSDAAESSLQDIYEDQPEEDELTMMATVMKEFCISSRVI